METPDIYSNRSLKVIFAISIAITTVAFVFAFLYTSMNKISLPNPVLEQYVILITFIGIPLVLKIFHDQVKKSDRKDTETFSKKYKQYYLLRITVLDAICLLNSASLFITGSKNFLFMSIISIFVFFFCIPQKSNILAEEEQNEDEKEEEKPE